MTHNLGTQDVVVQVYEKGSPYREVRCEVERSSMSAVTLGFSEAVWSGVLRCVVMAV